MIYIKIEGTEVTLAGTITNQQMRDDGYVPYMGVIPVGNKLSWDETTNTIINDDAAELEEVRAKRFKEFGEAYGTTIYADIDYMATTFQADADSQNLMANVLSAGSVPVGFFWLDINNAQVAMTFDELQGLALAMLTRGQVAFSDMQDNKILVRAATTEDDINAVSPIVEEIVEP